LARRTPAVVSFNGGKDATIILYLTLMARMG
jgi:3'-phosphoadenosine 5'-phosphosulfate sulfotransferase (PAPS reductase)/FAD synthetase